MARALKPSPGDPRVVPARIDIATTPAEAARMAAADCYVVIDALRATTVMAVLFHRGMRQVRAVADLELARYLARNKDSLLVGEVNGLPPEGFDFGNSPVEVAQGEFAGRTAVHFTTNGTLGLTGVARLGPTIAGSMVNLGVVANFVDSYERVTFVCAGNARGTVFSLEDFAVAAAFVQRLEAHEPGASLGDAAALAVRISRPELLITQSEHATVTRNLGLEPDIDFCAWPDIAPAIPFVTEFGDDWALLEDRLLP